MQMFKWALRLLSMGMLAGSLAALAAAMTAEQFGLGIFGCMLSGLFVGIMWGIR